MRRIIIIGMVFLFSIQSLQVVRADSNGPQEELTALIEIQTKSSDREERKSARMRLSQFEPRNEADIDVLVHSIRTTSNDGARKALGNIRDLGLVPKLISVLEDRNDEVKRGAIGALARLKDKRAVPALIKKLDDQEFIATMAGEALAEIGDESAIPELIARIGKSDASIGVGLAKFGAPGLNAIVKEIKDAKGSPRFRMIQAIGFIDDPEAVPMLKEQLKHKDPRVRDMAAQSLGNMGALNVREAIKDEDAFVRMCVLRAARKTEDPGINQVVIDIFLNDNNEGVRCVAANVLADRRVYEAIPYLEDALKYGSQRVQRCVDAALRKIRGQ